MWISMSEWIKCSERLPPKSYIESDDADIPYEAHRVLLLIPNSQDYDVMCGWYEEEDLSPFPNIPRWIGWVITDEDGYCVDLKTPTHWMPLPKPPQENK